jgi:hypothetical protein
MILAMLATEVTSGEVKIERSEVFLGVDSVNLIYHFRFIPIRQEVCPEQSQADCSIFAQRDLFNSYTVTYLTNWDNNAVTSLHSDSQF